ncbi:MAG: HD domain-containing protein [Acidobacteria bacterium]|nr:MAG: HD domain-containing protein [Acidobacteriota bacterium]
MDDGALLDLLLELQALDRVPRSGYALRGVDRPESVSEHSFHLAFLVWALAAREPEVDGGRAVALALVHDLVEVRTGDLPRTAARYWPAGAKARAERAIAAELLAPLGDGAQQLFAEYQAGETAEARFVKRCDELQVRLKVMAYERWGSGSLDDLRAALADLDDGGFASIGALLAALDCYDRRPS